LQLLGTPSEKIWTGYKDLPGVQKMKFVDYPISHLRDRVSFFSPYVLVLAFSVHVNLWAQLDNKNFKLNECGIDLFYHPTLILLIEP
jgi:hypothetical protein